MACRLASVPVLTVSVLKRLQDLGNILFSLLAEILSELSARLLFRRQSVQFGLSLPVTGQRRGNFGDLGRYLTGTGLHIKPQGHDGEILQLAEFMQDLKLNVIKIGLGLHYVEFR
jgi:hypothetical protein